MKQAAEGGTVEAHELDWLCSVQNLRMDGKILVQIVRLHGGYEEDIRLTSPQYKGYVGLIARDTSDGRRRLGLRCSRCFRGRVISVRYSDFNMVLRLFLLCSCFFWTRTRRRCWAMFKSLHCICRGGGLREN